MDLIVAVSQAWTDSIGLAFTWLLLLPVLATGLIILAIVSARGEKAENEKLAGRWGPRARRSDD